MSAISINLMRHRMAWLSPKSLFIFWTVSDGRKGIYIFAKYYNPWRGGAGLFDFVAWELKMFLLSYILIITSILCYILQCFCVKLCNYIRHTWYILDGYLPWMTHGMGLDNFCTPLYAITRSAKPRWGWVDETWQRKKCVRTLY